MQLAAIDESINLNQKQLLFANHYLKCFDRDDAYEKAGYTSKTKKSLWVKSHQLLNNPKIKLYVKEKLADYISTKEALTARIIKETRDIAFSNIMDFVEVNNGKLKVKNLNGINTAAIKEIKQDKDGCFTIKLHSKSAAMDKMYRYLDMYADEIEVSKHEAINSFIDRIISDGNDSKLIDMAMNEYKTVEVKTIDESSITPPD